MKKLKIAIVGYGQFGQLIAKHLEPYVEVIPMRRDTPPETISSCNMVIFAVPWGDLEKSIKTLRPHIKAGTLIVDVTSIKQKPLALLKKYFKGYEILGTHPIFGPQSAKNGITDLPIVLCNVSFGDKNYTAVKSFLSKKLKLKLIEQTPKQHDSDMAEIQGLTHFIGRAIIEMKIKSHLTNTKSYEQLLNLRDLLANDSWELFKTIQNVNPEAKKVRAKFLKQVQNLEKKLSQ